MTSGIIFFVLGLIPLAFIIAFSGLELAIAFIQAQVFVVLSCSYIKDGLDLHTLIKIIKHISGLLCILNPFGIGSKSNA